MLQGRTLCRISLLFVLIIAFSAYTPWDVLGVYDKALAAEKFLTEGEEIAAEGYVYHKEIKNDKILYFVKDASVKTKRGNLFKTSFIFKLDSDEIPNNSKVNIEGLVKPFSKARNEGSFDMRQYYNSLGLYFEVQDVRRYSYSANVVQQLDIGYKIRQVFADIYEGFLPGEEAGLLSSIVIGEKGYLDGTLKLLFQSVGIAHILAVSGLHVSVVCMAFYNLLRRFGFRFIFSGFFSGIIAIVYGIVTGGSISAVRAIGMFLIYLGAQIWGESYDGLTGLAILADVLLWIEPLYIKNVSFIFSFGAVLTIFVYTIPFVNAFGNYFRLLQRNKKSEEGFIQDTDSFWQRFNKYILNSLVFSFGMYVAMLPLTTQLFYQTPICSVVLNLLVLPFMPVLLFLGLFAGIIGVLSLSFAGVLLVPCHYIIYGYEMLSGFFEGFHFSNLIVGHRSYLGCCLYYLILYLILYKGNSFRQEDGGQRAFVFKRRFLLHILGFLLIAIIWLLPRGSDFEIDFIDVGQGDGIYVDSGDGVKYFIDGGSTSQKEIGKYTLLPFLKYKGVMKIDYWFLSHTDEDHLSGLLELLEMGYRIDNLVLSKVIPRDESYEALVELAGAHDTNVIYMDKGDELNTKHLSFKCVYPSEDVADLYSDDVNALSLSLLMNYDEEVDGVTDFSSFFGGDIAAEQEAIIAASGYVGHVNLLKVSHHGSRFSSDSSFVETLSPDLAIISCSKKNRYGHPSQEAIERIEACGANIFYTMNSGRVRINSEGIDVFVK